MFSGRELYNLPSIVSNPSGRENYGHNYLVCMLWVMIF